MTNLITLRTTEEFMSDYTPAYHPILPLFLAGKSQQYAVEAGAIDFKRATTIGDIRAKFHGPKDTTLHQIAAKSGSKQFKKYFMAAQYIQSNFQDQRDFEAVVSEVLDEHNKQADELFLLGEGTSGGTVINNGLYWSGDPNYTLNSSAAIAAGSDANLSNLYTNMVNAIQLASETEGRLLVLVYGDTVMAKYNGLFTASARPFSEVLSAALPNVSFAKLPAAVTPASAAGYIIVNLDKVKLHYTLLPEVRDQGVNAEKMYAWTNFLMGSMMLDVMAKGAVTRQPLTFS